MSTKACPRPDGPPCNDLSIELGSGSSNTIGRHEAFLEKFCSATESQWRRMRSKDLGKIAFAMYTMNYGDRSRLEGLSNALSKVKRCVLFWRSRVYNLYAHFWQLIFGASNVMLLIWLWIHLQSAVKNMCKTKGTTGRSNCILHAVWEVSY